MCDSYYGEGSRTYPPAAESYINGLCTGLLAAAAISSANAITDLTEVAVEAVLVAFRTGLRTMDVRNRISKKSTTSSDWSVVVSGMDEKTAVPALQEFSRAKVGLSLLPTVTELTVIRAFLHSLNLT